MFLVSTFAGGTLWPYVASVACAVVAFFLLFLGFLRLRGSIRDAVAGSFLSGYFWLLSQLLFLPRSRDGLLQNASGQLVLQQSNSATIAKTSNSSRPTGSVGSWIELDVSFPELVADVASIRQGSGERVQLGPPPRCRRLGRRPALVGVLGGRDWCRLDHDRRR
jgi:hypothetical protein